MKKNMNKRKNPEYLRLFFFDIYDTTPCYEPFIHIILV